MVLLPSWDTGLGIRDRVTVAPVTSTIRDLDTEVLLGESDGLPRLCAVNLDIIATILYTALEKRGRVTRLGLERMRQVDRAIHIALGLSLPGTVE